MRADTLRSTLCSISLLVALCTTTLCVVADAQQPPLRPVSSPGSAPGQLPPPPVQQGKPLDNQPAPPPFVLTQQQQDYLDQVLAAWETHTNKIKTFRCTFTRWQFDPAFAVPQFPDRPGTQADGELTYSAPDKGSYKITKIYRLNAQTGDYDVAKDEIGEHWVSDGKSFWEYDAKQKLVVERPIPPEMRGKAISNGPLPFLFGAESAKLKQRYFLRINTPEKFAETEIWVDAFPRFRTDAANFQRATLILKQPDFEPYAMRIYDPGNQNAQPGNNNSAYSSYEFKNVSINDPLEKLRDVFAPPKVPFGWRKVRDESGSGQPAPPPTAAPAAAAQGQYLPRR